MLRKKIKKMPKGYDKNFKPKAFSEEWRKILLDYHFFCAKRFSKGYEKLREIANNMKTIKEQRTMHDALRLLQDSRSLLDDHYHGLISDKEFNAWGHLWYSEDGKIHHRAENL